MTFSSQLCTCSTSHTSPGKGKAALERVKELQPHVLAPLQLLLWGLEFIPLGFFWCCCPRKAQAVCKHRSFHLWKTLPAALSSKKCFYQFIAILSQFSLSHRSAKPGSKSCSRAAEPQPCSIPQAEKVPGNHNSAGDAPGEGLGTFGAQGEDSQPSPDVRCPPRIPARAFPGRKQQQGCGFL